MNESNNKGSVKSLQDDEKQVKCPDCGKASSEQYKENWANGVTKIAEQQSRIKELVEALEESRVFILQIDDEGEGKSDWKIISKIDSVLSKANTNNQKP